ncbi:MULTISPECIES: SseB family protein [unclassified Arthrobacter]|uniref:SseB family protein n=1 Tax=unclassified Arthrobacter TaxID=235627 RepID=UPI00210404B3|nr:MULTISPECIES: SseB family protein [unclassified Arthrobacter]MCQ1948060.1 SseB family protein [Arthrobacter sp. zg-Y1116]MCQ1987996.1 SseB family protein [Arthrobacter sp. zg-Y844]MCQ1996037.1 SseB family protein [Arthrobacter sp. zg-Y1171]UWX82892.1 SseB family protein [Arthrobacter sp. zg-Y1171]
MAARELPGHIAAALAGAGGPTDSAGRPWSGRDLAGEGNPLHNFDSDNGQTDAGYAAALAKLIAGSGSEAEVVASLATARVFVPIIAVLGEEAESDHGLTADKQADMALVTLNAPDGRKALPVFTSVDALEHWHPEARPVAVYANRAALSAVAEDAQLLVIDPGAEFTFVVRRPAMWALARQQEWVPSYADAGLVAAAEAAAGPDPRILAVTLQQGPGTASRTAAGTPVAGGGAGPELRMVLQLAPGLDPQDVSALAAGLQQRLTANPEFVERVDSLDLKITR